jgi:hypothetical protein
MARPPVFYNGSNEQIKKESLDQAFHKGPSFIRVDSLDVILHYLQEKCQASIEQGRLKCPTDRGGWKGLLRLRREKISHPLGTVKGFHVKTGAEKNSSRRSRRTEKGKTP